MPSSPVILAAGADRFSIKVSVPVPQPRSSTSCSGWMFARSTMRRLNGARACPSQQRIIKRRKPPKTQGRDIPGFIVCHRITPFFTLYGGPSRFSRMDQLVSMRAKWPVRTQRAGHLESSRSIMGLPKLMADPAAPIIAYPRHRFRSPAGPPSGPPVSRIPSRPKCPPGAKSVRFFGTSNPLPLSLTSS